MHAAQQWKEMHINPLSDPILWSYMGPIQKQQQVHYWESTTQAARFVLNDYKRKSSVNVMLTALGWETLELHRIRLRLITIYKETHQITPSNLRVAEGTNLHETRQNTGPFIVPQPSFNKLCYQFSLYPRTIREWHMLPPNVRSAPNVDTFKRRIEKVDLLALFKKTHYKA